ncbi:acetyl-CoA synthetase-like protein [Aureobasidium sp. EXF-8845]|nr:acetyl-CoA synthetase-like protein [Aureobasidium sp. EXF-8845]KAI4853361.1 acetyl-CoA synthetase-like protein [Aureobasidium sp. EXF-8846]
MNGNRASYAILEGGPAHPINESIWSSFVKIAKTKPDHPAVVSRNQPSDLLASVVGSSSGSQSNGLEWTYSQLIQGASNIASMFQKQGTNPNSVLLAFLPPVCAEWSLLWLAANCIGITLVTIDKRALEPARADELTYYIRSLQPAVVVIHESNGAEAVDKVCAELQHTINCKMTLDNAEGTTDWYGLARFDSSVKANRPAFGGPHTDYDRTAVILYTSGTSTGQPKGCPLTEKNLIHGWSDQNPSPADSRMSMMFANSRAINLHLSSQCWLVGGTIVYLDTGFTPEGVLSIIEQERLTIAIFIPPMLKAMVKYLSFSKEKVKTLTKVFIGGDIATADLQDLAVEYFPTAQLVSTYAMTEGLWITGWPSSQAPSPLPLSMGLLASGSVLAGNTLKIVGDDGCIVKKGKTGDIHIQSPVMINAYRENAAADTFYEDEEGRWFKTGDIGFIDEEDLVYVIGRKKDIIKRLGIPIPPILLENVLAQFGGVQASIFGLPNPKLGEEVVAVVLDMIGTTSQRLQDLVVEHLGPDYPISKVFTLQELGMQKFPFNVTGKVMKIELRKAVEDLLL